MDYFASLALIFGGVGIFAVLLGFVWKALEFIVASIPFLVLGGLCALVYLVTSVI